MMVAIFVTMLAALALGWLGYRRLAIAAAALCFACALWLFQWEIYSPTDGYRMPWIDTRLDLPHLTTQV
jgi:4-hydroxybenzoate polyprenyltransferase